MSAEAIARVVADIRSDRIRRLPGVPVKGFEDFTGPVVDATAIYESLLDREEIAIYEDHSCIAPPWEEAAICYVNGHGNVIVMLCATLPADHIRWKSDANDIDWDRVRWKLHTFVFCGGRSPKVGPVKTTGPVHLWQFAIYEDGEPADLHWVQLTDEYPMTHWDMAQLVLLGSLNYLNCRNVQLVEPRRSRPEMRRLARTGVTVSTINVFPVGKATRSGHGEPGTGVPLTSVRGHFARYGPQYDRGLLFGKYAGRYWVPQYARGSKELGESQHDYKLTP